MAAKLKALQLWCKKACEGYRDVDVVDMTKSWKSGLAFCAIIHRFRPDLIDYDSLNKENVYENNKLAFTVAQEKLGIPALLDAEDMVAMDVPDRLCMCTYVSQYANYFQGKPQLGGPGVSKAGKRMSTDQGLNSAIDTKRPAMAVIQNDLPKPAKPSALPDSTPAQAKNSIGRKNTYGDQCAVCEGKVFLVERHIENGTLYHRRCYRDQQKTASLRRGNTSFADLSGSSIMDSSAFKSPSSSVALRNTTASQPTSADKIFTPRAVPSKPAVDLSSKVQTTTAPPSSGSVAAWKVNSTTDAAKDRSGSTALSVSSGSKAQPQITSVSSNNAGKTFSIGTSVTAGARNDVTPTPSAKSSAISSTVTATSTVSSTQRLTQPSWMTNKSSAQSSVASTTSTSTTSALSRPVTANNNAPGFQTSTADTKSSAVTSGVWVPPSRAKAEAPVITTSTSKSAVVTNNVSSYRPAVSSSVVTTRPTTASASTVFTMNSSVRPSTSTAAPASTYSVAGLSKVTATSGADTRAVSSAAGKGSNSVAAQPTFDKNEPVVTDLLKSLADIRKQRQSQVLPDAVPVSAAGNKSGLASNTAPKPAVVSANVGEKDKPGVISDKKPMVTTTTSADADLASVILKQVNGGKKPTTSDTQGYSTTTVSSTKVNNQSKINSTAVTVSIGQPTTSRSVGTTGVYSAGRTVTTASTTSSTSSSALSSASSTIKSVSREENAETSRSTLKRRTELPASVEIEIVSPPSLSLSGDGKPFSAFRLKDSIKQTNVKDTTDEGEGEMNAKRVKSLRIKPTWQMELEARHGTDSDDKEATVGTVSRQLAKVGDNNTRSDAFTSSKSTATATDKAGQRDAAVNRISQMLSKVVVSSTVDEDKKPRRQAPPPPSAVTVKSNIAVPDAGGRKIGEDRLMLDKNGTKVGEHASNNDSGNITRSPKLGERNLQRVDTLTATNLAAAINKQIKKPARPTTPDSTHTYIFSQPSSDFPSPIVSSNVPKPRYQVGVSGSNGSESSEKPAFESTPVTMRGNKTGERKKVGVDVNFSFNASDFDNLTLHKFNAEPPSWIKTRPLPATPVHAVPKRRVHAETYVDPSELEEQIATLDFQLREMEHEGRSLEESIRSTDGSEDDEEMMLKWFELVNKKNELVRMETDLVYKQQQQQLEATHEEIEHELRVLTSKPDHEMTPSERVRVAVLLQELQNTVLERNSIIDCMEEDRQRYLLEDEHINSVLASKFLSGKKAGKKKKNRGKNKRSSWQNSS